MNNVTAIVAVVLGSLAAAVLVTIFHPGDNSVLITIIFAAAAPTTAALLSLVKSSQNSSDIAVVDAKTNRLSVTVDGRLQQLLDARTDAAGSAGELKGQQDERYRAALLAVPPHAIDTPVHGTTIAPGGPTQITPDGPVTIIVSKDVTKIDDL